MSTVKQPFTKKLFATIFLGILGSTVVNAESLIDACNQCHNETRQDVPVINGVSAFYLESSMLAYIDGQRIARLYENQDMKKIVQNLKEAELKTLIEHYSAQPYVGIKQTIDKVLANKGKTIHDTYCERCHTDNGAIADDDSGILAGQWKGYLIAEIQAYKNGQRTGDKKMQDAINALSEDHIKALAEFYASQTN